MLMCEEAGESLFRVSAAGFSKTCPNTKSILKYILPLRRYLTYWIFAQFI